MYLKIFQNVRQAYLNAQLICGIKDNLKLNLNT